ncbi:MAG: zf-HC2 domain-containing protein [Oscillospiraceae bacterium]|nr:zf-HC2 domain-containing protein [Oscillospiraceae bacterium]
MSACERWQELMSQMLDDEITPEDAAALRSHMRTCQSCQAMWNLLFTVSHTIQQDIAQPPTELSQGVMARVRAENARNTEASGIGRNRKNRVRRLPVWTRAAAAACLVVVIGAVAFASWDGRGRASSSASLSIRSADTAAAETVEMEMDTAEEITEETTAEEEVYEDEAVEAAEDTETNTDVSAAAGEALDAGAAAEDESGLAVCDMDGNYLGTISEENEDAFAALLDATAYNASEIEPEDICSVEYQGVIYIFSTTDSGLLLWRDAAEGGSFCSTSSAEALWALIS